LIAAFINFGREKQFRALEMFKEDFKIAVIRNSHVYRISKFQLLVGDIILLSEGDIVPTHSMLFSGNVLCDESHITPNSAPVRKNPLNFSSNPNTIFSHIKHSSSSLSLSRAGLSQNAQTPTDSFLINDSKVRFEFRL
jgi:P-type E1-E2 ATPase